MDFFVSFGRDRVTHKYGAAIEEGYLTTLSLPAKLQLKAGKFRQALGKINLTHPHALPFINLPNAFVNYFGEDGLNDEGVSLSWLLPNKAFYQEFIFQATSASGESPNFYLEITIVFYISVILKTFLRLQIMPHSNSD